MEHTMKDNENQWKMVIFFKMKKTKTSKTTIKIMKNAENMKNQDTHWTTSENNELHRKTMKIHENNGT